jgi:indole-3-glycerol phosphate synthase
MIEDFLATMAASSRDRVSRARALVNDRELHAKALQAAAPPRLQLTGQFDLITEVKLRSPAVGQLKQDDEDIGARVAHYAQAGAAAISVLTEPSRFDGELAHVTRSVQSLAGRVPVMRKDFLVDPYQVYEARAAGAGGVLIILRMLPRDELLVLIEAAGESGLFALLEGFDEPDLRLAQELVSKYARQLPLLVGVNCRDLATLEVVPGRLEELAPLLPDDVPKVAESGVTDERDAQRLAGCGYDVALVGSALMQAADPLQLARAMLAAGRTQAMKRCG